MPHTPSAKKRLKQTEVRRKRNKNVIRGLKEQMRKVTDAVKSGDAAAIEAERRVAAKKFDQAAAKGVVHKNLASRKKAQLSRLGKPKAAAKS